MTTLNPCDDTVIARLNNAVPGAVRPVEPRHLEEPRGLHNGIAGAVVAPADVSEVSAVIRIAAELRVPVIPYGGGTGLVGGQVIEDGPAPILLSLDRMTAIRSIHADENVLIAEAGAILQTVQEAAEGAGRLFPLSLASEGSARIGGLLGTNAGGVNVLRYGNARDLVLGLEAVLPDGSIWHGLRRLRKDNTGYDLRNLLIGAEGTLGVITAAALRLFPRPAATGAAVMVVPDPAAALALLSMAQARIGEGISAFELISGEGLRFLTETGFDIRQPFETPPDWHVLIDLGLPLGLDPSAALEALFADAFEADLVSDGLIAQSEQQRHDFWTVRETIPLANRKVGAIVSNDISLPLGRVAEFIDRAGAELHAAMSCRINCFGHLGDGNLHFNVFPAPGETNKGREADRKRAKTITHDLLAEMEGSISAEHGIGRAKVADLERYGDPVKLAAMRAIKDALDPAGIMNPGAVLRHR
ncbi:FAD-binding oxidoreductase [Anianabacter salinae]|uniref:FAD-binding oxidoreductase n=1 Tax=Anianabacter salinae TaxID=2851023 RepID=UPI00225E6311|nr:FAD-binding oxidoreductase [Anianabacter salinae]MBV0911312.1 FAD-binding oxidoreductase [Anianabacter salinae]